MYHLLCFDRSRFPPRFSPHCALSLSVRSFRFSCAKRLFVFAIHVYQHRTTIGRRSSERAPVLAWLEAQRKTLARFGLNAARFCVRTRACAPDVKVGRRTGRSPHTHQNTESKHVHYTHAHTYARSCAPTQIRVCVCVYEYLERRVAGVRAYVCLRLY